MALLGLKQKVSWKLLKTNAKLSRHQDVLGIIDLINTDKFSSMLMGGIIIIGYNGKYSVCVVVQYYPWFQFNFPLFQTHYHTVPYPNKGK